MENGHNFTIDFNPIQYQRIWSNNVNIGNCLKVNIEKIAFVNCIKTVYSNNLGYPISVHPVQ